MFSDVTPSTTSVRQNAWPKRVAPQIASSIASPIAPHAARRPSTIYRTLNEPAPLLLSTQTIAPLKPTELVLFSLIATLLLAIQITLAGPATLYDRTCWIDEYITQLIVSDPSTAHATDAVRAGVDTNPPVYHLIGRGVVNAVRTISPVSIRVALRAFSTLCVLIAIVAAYALLRHSFGAWPSVIGLLAVWPHPQLIEQLFEARFYAPMLAAAMVLALALQHPAAEGVGNGRSRVLRNATVAVAAILLCTIHYFGVIVLLTLLVATFCIDTGSWKHRLLRLAPAAAGLIALAPFIAFVHSQAAGLTRATFLIPFSPRAAREFLVDVFYPLPMLVMLAGWAAGQLLRQTTSDGPHLRMSRLRATVPLLSLAAVPIVILAFSAVVQSALRPRYALVATFAVAPVAAMLAGPLRPRMLAAIAMPLAIMGMLQIVGTAKMHNEVQKITAAESVLARTDSPAVPIVFADRGDAIELSDLAPDLFSRIVLVDERSAGTLSTRRRYDLEMNEKARPFYPTSPLVSLQQLARFDRVRIIASSDDLNRLLLAIPMRRVGDSLYEPIRDTTTASSESLSLADDEARR